MSWERYRIPTRPAPHAAPHPSRFKVEVNRPELAKLLVREIIHYRGDLDVAFSRPCVYGVFSGVLGGFLPREQQCVGCLRCTVQHPDIVQILPNPARSQLGDSYFDPGMVETVLYEAATGIVPVRGAGYGGKFGGTGWDAMWTDMSEIVRPTRDGIHGREFISTEVQIGPKPLMVEFDESGRPVELMVRPIAVPIPILFDRLPIEHGWLYEVVAAVATVLGTLAVIPWNMLGETLAGSPSVVPLVPPEQVDQVLNSGQEFKMLELEVWDRSAFETLTGAFPSAVIAVRLGMDADPGEALACGSSVLHVVADYHGRAGARFALEAIKSLHERLIDEGVRERITLIGSGGIIAAEHVPKAIIAGLDAVALDTALIVALQARFEGELLRPEAAAINIPPVDAAWASQRLVNLIGSWRDQLLEILGAMGLREVRRLRGEIGRAMFQRDLEQEAFAGIKGYPTHE